MTKLFTVTISHVLLAAGPRSIRLTTTHRGHCPSDGGMSENTFSLVVHGMQITCLSNCNHTLLERFITRNQFRHTRLRVMISITFPAVLTIAQVMIIFGQYFLLLSFHGPICHRFHQHVFPHRLTASVLRRISSSLLEQITEQHSSGFHTTDCRGSRGSCCNSCPMFGVFLHCTAVLSDYMAHPQPSLSGTGVLWVGTHWCLLIHPGRAVD